MRPCFAGLVLVPNEAHSISLARRLMNHCPPRGSYGSNPKSRGIVNWLYGPLSPARFDQGSPIF
jgi:hypothetical protein